jgi:hypothetical protein
MGASKCAVDASVSSVLALDCMEKEDGGADATIFLRIPESLKRAWVEACADRKIVQNEAGEALIWLLVAQEPTIQQQMFGSLPAPGGKIVCVAPKKARVGHSGNPGDLKPKRRNRRSAPGSNPKGAEPQLQ